MFKFRGLVFAIVGVTTLSLAQPQEETKPTLSPVSLTADQIAVYRTFLQSYDNGSHAVVNLANKTIGLDLPDTGNPLMSNPPECLKGIKLEDTQAAASIVHILDESLAVKGRVLLVDPEQQSDKIKANDPSKSMREGKSAEHAVTRAFASGLLTLSEIAFDKDHHWAVLNFSFSCGRLCGHGGTLVLEKTGGEWKITKRECAAWIS